jgi:hypothetical protein
MGAKHGLQYRYIYVQLNCILCVVPDYFSHNVFFAEFEDLFETYADGITVVKWEGDFNQNSVLTKVKEMNAALNINVLFQSPRTFQVDTTFNISASRSTQADLVFYWTASSHAPKDTSCKDYMSLKHLFYTSLRPSPTVLQTLLDVSSSLGLAHSFRHFTMANGGASTGADDDDAADTEGGGGDVMVVGVHIRAHDEAYDWAVVPPSISSTDLHPLASDPATETGTAQKSALQFDESTPLEVVIASMTSIITKHPSVLFFVASNSHRIKEQLIEYFGTEHILTLFAHDDISTSRNKTAGIQLALLDFYLLGMASDFLLHSKGSSFAIEASYLCRSSPLSVVDMTMSAGLQNDQLMALNVYKHDTRLAYCGLDEYYNTAMDQRSKHLSSGADNVLIDKPLTSHQVCYRDDDTADEEGGGRMLCTYLQKLRRCEWATTMWGIDNLYCLNFGNVAVADEELYVQCSAQDSGFLGSLETERPELPPYICIPTDSRGY